MSGVSEWFEDVTDSIHLESVANPQEKLNKKILMQPQTL